MNKVEKPSVREVLEKEGLTGDSLDRAEALAGAVITSTVRVGLTDKETEMLFRGLVACMTQVDDYVKTVGVEEAKHQALMEKFMQMAPKGLPC